jgi:hypothetical protein
VFDGKAAVSSNGQKPITVKAGHELAVNRDAAKAERFDEKGAEDAFTTGAASDHSILATQVCSLHRSTQGQRVSRQAGSGIRISQATPGHLVTGSSGVRSATASIRPITSTAADMSMAAAVSITTTTRFRTRRWRSCSWCPAFGSLSSQWDDELGTRPGQWRIRGGGLHGGGHR